MVQHPFSPKSLVGKRITSINRVLYCYQGEIEPGDGPLELVLDGQPILFDAGPDGESLRVRSKSWSDPFGEPLSPENREYVETHGKWQRVNCAHSNNYSDLLGHRVTDARLLANQFGRVAGVRLSASGHDLWFVVHGDESHVYWVQPIGFTEIKP